MEVSPDLRRDGACSIRSPALAVESSTATNWKSAGFPIAVAVPGQVPRRFVTDMHVSSSEPDHSQGRDGVGIGAAEG